MRGKLTKNSAKAANLCGSSDPASSASRSLNLPVSSTSVGTWDFSRPRALSAWPSAHLGTTYRLLYFPALDLSLWLHNFSDLEFGSQQKCLRFSPDSHDRIQSSHYFFHAKFLSALRSAESWSASRLHYESLLWIRAISKTRQWEESRGMLPARGANYYINCFCGTSLSDRTNNLLKYNVEKEWVWNSKLKLNFVQCVASFCQLQFVINATLVRIQ